MLWTSVNHRLKDRRSCKNTAHCYLSSANTHWLQDGHLETLAQFISVRQAVKTEPEPGVVCNELKLNYNPRFCSDLFLVGFCMIIISGFCYLFQWSFCLWFMFNALSSSLFCLLYILLYFNANLALFVPFLHCFLFSLITFCFMYLISHLWLPLLAFVYL